VGPYAVRLPSMAVSRGTVSGSGTAILLDYAASTFARASEAASYDLRTGLWGPAWLGTDVAPILPDGAIRIEGSRTNKVVNSQAGGALGAATLTSNVADGPDGSSLTADRITSTGTALDARWRYHDKGAVIPASIFSCFVKAGTQGSYCDIDHGTTVNGDPRTPIPAAWSRLVKAVTSTSRYISVCLGYHDGTQTGASGDNLLCWGWETQEGTFTSSPIRTTGAEATRAVDICSFAVGTALDAGRWAVDVWPEMTHTILAALAYDPTIYLRDATHHLAISRGAGTPKVQLTVGGVVVALSSALTWSAHQQLTVTIDWNARTMTVAGATTGNGTTAITGVGTWADATGTVLRVGSSDAAGATPLFGCLSRPVAV